MTEEEIKAIEIHTEIHEKAEPRAIKITKILRKAVRELRENNRLAQHILELQKDKGNLVDELTKKANTNHSLVEQMAEQNERLEVAKEFLNACICKARGNINPSWSELITDIEQFLKE